MRLTAAFVLFAALATAEAGPPADGPGLNNIPRPPKPRAKLAVEDTHAHAEQLKAAFRKRRGRVLGCYAKALSSSPTLRGAWMYVMQIAKSGVPKVNAASHVTGADTFEKCVLLQLKQIRFKPGQEGVLPFKLIFVGDN